MKKVYTILLMAGMIQIGCSSAPQKTELGAPQKPNREVIAKIQSIDEELAHFSIPDERKHQLKLDKAKLLLDAGNYDEATILLKEVLQAKSEVVNNSEVNLYLGKAYYSKSDYSSAINYLNTSEKLDRNPYHHERKKMVAKSLYEEQEYYPALAALSKAYKSPETPKDQFYYETAAQTYYKMGYTNKSIDFYKKSLQVAELGMKEYPDSIVLKRIHKDTVEALGPSK